MNERESRSSSLSLLVSISEPVNEDSCFNETPLSPTPEADDVVSNHWLGKTLKGQEVERLGLDLLLDHAVDRLRDQNLAALGFVAEARGEVHDRPDRGVVEAPPKADLAKCRVAHRDPDAEVELMAALPPCRAQLADPGTHLDRHTDGALGGVGAGKGVVEEDHHSIPGEMLDRSLVAKDQLAHSGVELLENSHHLFRLSRLGERGEAAQVAENDGDFLPVVLQKLLLLAR